jgi:hypothetical protein
VTADRLQRGHGHHCQATRERQPLDGRDTDAQTGERPRTRHDREPPDLVECDACGFEYAAEIRRQALTVCQ